MNFERLTTTEFIVLIIVAIEVFIVFAALIALLIMRRRSIGREQRYDRARRELSDLMPQLTEEEGENAHVRAVAIVRGLGPDSGRRLLTELAEFVTLDHAKPLARVFIESAFGAVSAAAARRQAWERNRCIREARALADPADVLSSLVRDTLPDVRLSAFEALCALGRAQEGLVSLSAIAKDGRLARTRAIDALAATDPMPVEDLAEASRTGDADLRLISVGALGRSNVEGALELVIHAVTDEDVEVRIEALRGLAELDEPAALPAVLRALTDEFWEVRSAAVSTAAKLGGDGAAQPIAKLLDDPAEWVRHNAALALTRCGAQGTAALREAAARGSENASSALAEHRLATEGA